METVSHKHLWFTRRDGEIRGPFPARQITRYILLGRIRPNDELSRDRETWQSVADAGDLLPKELGPDATEVDHERLLLALRREDERLAGDRRSQQTAEQAREFERRRHGERRQPEAEEVVNHREVKTQFLREATARPAQGLRQLAIVGAILAAILVITFAFTPEQNIKISRCGSAVPGVNWDNCMLEGHTFNDADLRNATIRNADLSGVKLRGAKLSGADFSYSKLSIADMSYSDLTAAHLVGTGLRNADLSYTKLDNADLSYANLAGANLGAAELNGARFDHAIWIDGRVCGVDSTGGCR